MSDAKVEQILRAIAAGDLDERQIGSIFDACAQQMASGAIGVRWQIEIPAYQVSFGEDDVTLADARRIKRMTGRTTGQLDLIGDAADFLAVVEAWVVNHLDWDEDEAAKRIGAIPVNEAAELVKTVAVKDDPKDRPGIASGAGT